MDHYQIVAEPENKAAATGTQQILDMIHLNRYRSGISSLVIQEAIIETLYHGRVHKLSCPFLENFNRKTAQLCESGIYDQWDQTRSLPKDYKPKLEEIPPQVLTTDHLSIGFKVFLIPLLFTILVFALEICFSRL